VQPRGKEVGSSHGASKKGRKLLRGRCAAEKEKAALMDRKIEVRDDSSPKRKNIKKPALSGGDKEKKSRELYGRLSWGFSGIVGLSKVLARGCTS